MTPPSQSNRWRRLRRCLLAAAVVLTLIAAFYTEEKWRGKRAWENCKRGMEAKGIKMDWAEYIPAPVPDAENVFAVPEMQEWFVGRGGTELSKKILALGSSNSSSPRISVAEVAMGLPGAVPPSGFAVLSYGDAQAKAQMSRLIEDAIGPSARDPLGLVHTLRRAEEIQPAKIFLQCQTNPTAKDLEHFLPSPIIPAWRLATWNEQVHVTPASNGFFQVTILAPDTTAEYLASNAPLEPEFTLIRRALQRPYTRINGDYQIANEIPIPNFVTVRAISQRLGALAQCHLLQGQPEEALRDLTLVHDLCRILESRPSGNPMTLVAAMIHVAVSGLYTGVIADGLAWHAWREPQLVALQEQLKETSLLPNVRRAFRQRPVWASQYLERLSVPHMGIETSRSFAWIPRGWIYQNMFRGTEVTRTIIDSMDPADQMVFPKKVDAVQKALEEALRHYSPYTFLMQIGIPNFSRASLTTANNQTLVNEALIACALERYRLAHNAYPETLDALVPQYLAQVPGDIIGGQPLHYRRADDGKFLLYSIGWNETDDGGKPGSNDDWVWDDTVR